MTQYLCIENIGECPVEAFTMLGVSTSRGEEGSIGQFGTGAKHGVLTLLRADLPPILYSGRDKIVPFTETTIISNKAFERVCYRIGNRTEKTSMTLDFGEIDWSEEVPMALREFICNALDQVGQDWDSISLSVVDNPRAKSGTTRIFVPLDHSVKRYLSEVNWRFLHVTNQHKLPVIDKEVEERPKIYRKGVFVRQCRFGDSSLFDYNFGDELPIDESRNMDDYKAKSAAAKHVCNHVNAVRKILREFKRGNVKFWEADFSSWYLDETSEVLEAFIEECGVDTVICEDIGQYQIARNRGKAAVIIYGGGWYECLKNSGITTAKSLMSHAEKEGWEELTVTRECVTAVNDVWEMLKDLELTLHKDTPGVRMYFKPMTGKSMTYGFSDGESIWLHKDHATNKKTILEELCHHITGFHDETRDLQDFVLRVADSLRSIIYD